MARSILLVDDDENVARIFITIVEHLGYTCSHAWDGREGVDMALSCQPDIIFMDLMMPIMDGLEATRRIKATPILAHIPIVIFSSAAGEPLLGEAVKTDVADVLMKPASIATIDRVLRAHFTDNTTP